MTTETSPATERTIAACLAQGRCGFTIGNRVSLPFRAELISILIGRQYSMLGEPERITDFSPASEQITVIEKEDRTDLYFKGHESLQDELGHWRGKMIVTCCEKGADIFDLACHQRLVLTFRDDTPLVKIELQREEI